MAIKWGAPKDSNPPPPSRQSSSDRPEPEYCPSCGNLSTTVQDRVLPIEDMNGRAFHMVSCYMCYDETVQEWLE